MAPNAGLNELLQQCLAGHATRPVVISAPATAGAARPISAHFTRLDGALGPHAVVAFYPLLAQGSPPLVLDALTQMPDRRALADRAAVWRRAAAGAIPRFAVLFLDVDDFKLVNDRHGHAVGDVVLHTLASRWLKCVRDGDLATRYGGDEFVLLIRDAATPDEVEPVMRRLAEAAQAPVVVDEAILRLGATIGWATPATPDWTIEFLIAAADADMYARKRRMLR